MCPGWYIFLRFFGCILQRLTRLLSQFQPINIPILHSIASISHYNFAKFHEFNWKLCLYLHHFIFETELFHVLSCLHVFFPSVFHFWIHIITNFGEKFILFFLICNNGLQGRAFFFFFFDVSFDFSFLYRFSLHKVLLIF